MPVREIYGLSTEKETEGEEKKEEQVKGKDIRTQKNNYNSVKIV